MARTNKRRADGRFLVRVYLGTSEDGKKKYKSFFGATMAEAQTAADQYRRKIHSVSAPRDATFRDLAGAWLEHKKRAVGAAQLTTLSGFINTINYEIGDEPVLEITPEMLSDVLADLAELNPHTGRPSSAATLTKYAQTLRAVFRFSRIQPDPAMYLEIPRGGPRHERRALTPEEQRRVCETEHAAQLPAMLALYAGLRRGEITALRWRDISDEYITVNKSFDFVAAGTKGTKTAAGTRRAYMLPPLREYLRHVRRGKPLDLVVTSAAGKQMTKSAWRKLWSSYLTDLDVKYGGRVKFSPSNLPGVYSIDVFTLHELRHTYATLLHDAGVDVKVAQIWLGHASASTTLNIYTHLSRSQQDAAVSSVAKFFEKTSV